VLLSPETIARMLAATGHDPTLAKHMPHGAIRFRAETDKQGYEDVSPISAPTRQALERYLRAHPRVGDVWMFPQPKHPERPINETLARILRIRAERLAELPLVEREGFIRTDVRTLPIGSIFPTSAGVNPSATIAAVSLRCTERLIETARFGWLVLEIHEMRAVEIAGRLGAAGYEDVTVSKDLAGRDRIVEGRWIP